MAEQESMRLALALLGVTLAWGLFLAFQRLGGSRVSVRLAAGHAGLAAAGLLALTGAVVGAPARAPRTSVAALLVLAGAAAAGLFLLLHHLRRERIPGALAWTHAALAAGGLLLLLAAVLL